MNKDFAKFYIVRHGETEWNVKRILQGHKDSPLTAKGLKEATELAAFLKNITFDTVFSSDLIRAKRTAEIVAVDHKLAVQTTQLLREGNFGDFEGKTVEEFLEHMRDLLSIRESLGSKEFMSFDLGHSIETGESMVQRFITFLREYAIAYRGKNVLVVSHGGMMRMLLVHLGFGTVKELKAGTVKNLGFIVLESDGTEFFIRETHNIEKTKVEQS